ncbi:hypothetical protein GCM10027075_05810 [Streptomyces heilongjiangensis]
MEDDAAQDDEAGVDSRPLDGPQHQVEEEDAGQHRHLVDEVVPDGRIVGTDAGGGAAAGERAQQVVGTLDG